MLELMQAVGDSDRFMPHGMCYLWEPQLLWTHVISDGLTWLAYWAIPPVLIYLAVQLRRESQSGEGYISRFRSYHWVFWAFGLFIVACGTTHLMAIVTVWRPEYWWSGSVKVVTALTSVATAVALPPLVPRIMGVLRDARTSQRRQHALEAANRELEELNRRLTESERTRTDFFANVSHELRTPLTLILGPLDRLSGSSSLDAEQQRSVAVIERNAQQLLSRVDDLLDVARMEWTEPTPEPQPIDLAELTRWVAEGFTGAAHSRNIAFEIHAPRALPATLDPNMVERIVMNLLSNAFKFTPDGGRIACTVEVEPPEPSEGAPLPRARIVVADNGPGIAPGERGAVFDRFRRFDDPSAPSGSGLGLAIVREFTTALGGSATVSETEGGGATLTITLPFETPDEPASEPPTREPATGHDHPHPHHYPYPQDGSETGSPQELVSGPPVGADPLAAPIEAVGTVLVVDDNEDLCRYLAAVLGTTYRVYAALDGSAGLARAEELRPDLIVTDMMMPRLTGEKLVEALQEHTHLKAIPVVVLTARTDAALPAHMLRFGALDFLTKPVQADELRERVRNLVDMARTRRILEKDADRSQRQLHELAQDLSHHQDALERSLDHQSLLLKELHHRVKGNLQTVASLLSLQARRVSEPTALQALVDARGRISAMGLVHEALYTEERPLHLDLGDHMERLASATVRSHARNPEHVRVSVQCEPIALDADLATPLALIAHELLTNALRHATPDGKAEIEVGLVSNPSDPDGPSLSFYVSDDGMWTEDDGSSGNAMGLTLVRDLCRQLGGTFHATKGNGGTRLECRMPLPDRAPVATGDTR